MTFAASDACRMRCQEFEAADRLETAYFAREHLEPDNDWHYEHNLDLLGTSYQYTGQIRRAAPLLEKAFALPTANLVQAVNKLEWPMFLRATAQPDAALVAARTLIAHPNLVVQAIGHIEAAHVLLARGQTTEGASEANAAIAALKQGAGGRRSRIDSDEGSARRVFSADRSTRKGPNHTQRGNRSGARRTGAR